MNLRGVATQFTSIINPQITVTITASTGYTTADDGSQMPSYAAPVTTSAQVQQLTAREIQHMDALNIQGNLRKVWLNGNWNGIIRPKRQGGDLMSFNGQNWLIVEVLEAWPDWCSVVVALQQ